MPVTISFRSLAVGAAAAIIVVGAYAWGHSAAAAPASPAPTPPTPTDSGGSTGAKGISVSGTGRVTGTPNLLRLQTSVAVTRPDVQTAMNEANTTMVKVQQTLKADGVAAADLQTSGLSVQPNYDYTSTGAKLKGYQVTENLSVVLRDLGKAGSIIADAARTGGDELRLGGASFDLDGDDALVAQARQRAFEDAKAKAQAYARAAGRSLGKVEAISEQTSTTPQPYAGAMATASFAADKPVPIEAGSQDVTVSVSVVWAME